MIIMTLNGNRSKWDDYKDLLDYVDGEDIPKNVYDSIMRFFSNSTATAVQLPNMHGHIRIVDAETLYNNYQLEWMIGHGYSIKNLINCLDTEIKYCEDPHDTLADLFIDWQLETGFNGELWVCYDEWVDNELFEMFGM